MKTNDDGALEWTANGQTAPPSLRAAAKQSRRRLSEASSGLLRRFAPSRRRQGISGKGVTL
jgi:hypothetical protein